jgi:hypothetical protein
MEIRKITAADQQARYDEVAASCGTIFNRLAWLRMFADDLDVYGIYNKDTLIGGFSLYTEKRFGMTVLRNPPFTQAIGPFLSIAAQNPVSVMNDWKKALSLMSDCITRAGWCLASFTLNKSIVDTQPFLWREFKVSPQYTYIIDLNVPLTAIRATLSSERRNDINKALRDGLVVEQVRDYHTVKDLVLKTFARQGKTLGEKYLDRILFDFSAGENAYAFTTYDNDLPIAVSFCIHDNDTAYYILGGYDDERRHHGAGALACWAAIENAHKLGLKQFDFEGSMVRDIERYFRGFGGKLTPYYRVSKAWLPLELALKFFKRGLF